MSVFLKYKKESKSAFGGKILNWALIKSGFRGQYNARPGKEVFSSPKNEYIVLVTAGICLKLLAFACNCLDSRLTIN